MCQHVYLIASAPLPLVGWDDTAPGFYVSEETNPGVQQMLERVVGSGCVFYSAGSFMGCSCGLFCDSSFQESEPETYAQRLADGLALKRYLLAEVRKQTVRLFTTDWLEFPDVYPRANLSLSVFDATAFDLSELPEDVILTVTP